MPSRRALGLSSHCPPRDVANLRFGAGGPLPRVPLPVYVVHLGFVYQLVHYMLLPRHRSIQSTLARYAGPDYSHKPCQLQPMKLEYALYAPAQQAVEPVRTSFESVPHRVCLPHDTVRDRRSIPWEHRVHSR
jgi:hypothetical protein